MKTIQKSTIIIIISAFAVGMLLGWLLFDSKDKDTHAHEIAQQKSEQIWTCSMHPSVRQKEPGKCPICGMDLVPLETDDSSGEAIEIRMSPAAMKLANIQTSVIGKEQPVKEIQLTGKVQPDERFIFTQTSHIAGRIEDLTVSITGTYVMKGQKIASVYSPDLVTAQKELFEAYKIRDTQPSLYEAARAKLRNWRLTNMQIDDVLKNEEPILNFPIHADVSGIVTERKVNLGDYVNRGAVIYEIADLSRLWILFDVYERDMPWVHVGDEVQYSVQSLPGASFTGKIDFIDPVISPKTRVAKARISVRNSSSRLKPEMFASGTISSKLESDGSTIVIPKTAVMWTGKRSVVYVKLASENGLSFIMREVGLGPAIGDGYVVEEGLQGGEEIATNGTFSIDAAAQLAGKPSMMSLEGGIVMTGHSHGMDNQQAHPAVVDQAIKVVPVGKEAKSALEPLYQAYLALKDAMVADDFKASLQKSKEFDATLTAVPMAVFSGGAHEIWMQQLPELKKQSSAMISSGDLEGIRKPFKPLSSSLIRLTQSLQPYEQILYVQHCPMADDFKGADWLSTEGKIENPYYGASMLACGEVKDTIISGNQDSNKISSSVKSPHTEAMANIGDNHVHIDYSSPRVRGRQIFGGLVAYGQVWSTGAHNATSISFTQDVSIQNMVITAGKYALFTIPGKEEWTIILNSNWDQHLADEYDQDEDIVRFRVKPTSSKEIQEELVFDIESIDQNMGIIHFRWERVSFSFNFVNN